MAYCPHQPDRAWCVPRPFTLETGKRARDGQEQYENTISGRGAMLSAVIPTLNATVSLPGTLHRLSDADEIVVVDGGSTDGTAELAMSMGARVVTAERGRGSQLAAGIAAARGEWLLLLHADTR